MLQDVLKKKLLKPVVKRELVQHLQQGVERWNIKGVPRDKYSS